MLGCRLVAGDRRSLAGRDAEGVACPDGADADPGPALREPCARIRRQACTGCICCPGLAWAPASPTTWASARRSRFSRCCWPSGGPARRCVNLLVGPASLLANWAAEIERFTPGLTAKIVHPSAMTPDQVEQVTPDQLSGIDLAITSYGTLLRMPVLAEMRWHCHSRRGAGDQEPERQADQGGQGPQGQGTHRADRNAGRKSPGRSVVDLRFHQSRPARNRQAVHQLHQEAGRAHTPMARSVNWCAPTSCGG